MVSRVERGPVADWMRTADRWLIGSFIALMVIGLVMALAASPAVAERLNLSTFHFVNRQALMLLPTAALMIATSFLSPRHVRRAALLTFAVSFALIILALMFGAEVKGARRWIFGLQPSEFIKPAFVVLAAWAFTEGGRTGPTAISGEASVLPAAADRHRAAHSRARLRSDDAGRGRVDGALLPGRPALVLGGRRRRHGHGRRLRRFQTFAARARARSALSRSGLDGRLGRHVPGRHRVAEHSLGRLAWTGPWRGRLQADPARRAHRLRFRRDRRRIRHDRLHGADRLLRLHRPARADPRCAQPGSVLSARGRRTDGHVRRAELDQHGGQLAGDAGQGNDLAVHLLRRLLSAGARPWHGLPRSRRRASAPLRISTIPRRWRDEFGARDSARGGRHGRTSLSSGGAGCRPCQAGRRSRAGDRQPGA